MTNKENTKLGQQTQSKDEQVTVPLAKILNHLPEFDRQVIAELCCSIGVFPVREMVRNRQLAASNSPQITA